MADYPLPKFHYQVEFAGATIGFTEVSGLDFETEVIEYRAGDFPAYHKTKQAGLTKYSNITLKKGMFVGDNAFYNAWKKTFFFQAKKENYRTDVIISLLNEEHAPIITWTVKNAWPSKIQSTDLKADANEVAIETMELVHEGLTMETK